MKTKDFSQGILHAEVSAWRNTPASAITLKGFGLRLGGGLRDAWLNPGATLVELHLEGMEEVLHIKLEPAFWKHCPEFKHESIGGWIAGQGLLVPWPKGKPYQFRIERLDGASFRVMRA